MGMEPWKVGSLGLEVWRTTEGEGVLWGEDEEEEMFPLLPRLW